MLLTQHLEDKHMQEEGAETEGWELCPRSQTQRTELALNTGLLAPEPELLTAKAC